MIDVPFTFALTQFQSGYKHGLTDGKNKLYTPRSLNSKVLHNYMIYSEIGQIECDCKTEKIRVYFCGEVYPEDNSKVISR